MSMKKNTNYDLKKLGVVIVAMIAMIAVAFSFKLPKRDGQESANNALTVTKDSDLVITSKDVTEKASFYPAEINGTNLEVIAVKAPDGSIRTAFNTCQVCYSSGRGYYQQEGEQLICQNCGNRFGMDDVEVTKGGCNPVPITTENKTVTDETITISKDFLTQATVIFQNWK